MNNAELRRHVFILTWRLLEDKGRVDGLGGAAFRRAFLEWNDAGAPLPAEDWLTAWAASNDRSPENGV